MLRTVDAVQGISQHAADYLSFSSAAGSSGSTLEIFGLLMVFLATFVQTRAEYKRKAVMLLELMAAQQQVNQEGGQEALQQQLSAFRGEVDAALLHMLARRLQAAQQHGQVGATCSFVVYMSGVGGLTQQLRC